MVEKQQSRAIVERDEERKKNEELNVKACASYIYDGKCHMTPHERVTERNFITKILWTFGTKIFVQ